MTRKTHDARHGAGLLLVLAALGLPVTPARAAEIWLRAGTTTKVLPGGTTVRDVGLRRVRGLVRLVRPRDGPRARRSPSPRRTRA